MLDYLKEGPTVIEIKTCAGCKYFRLAVNKYPQGMCYHPALEYMPQRIAVDDGGLPYLTPNWCMYEKIQRNINYLVKYNAVLKG